MSIPCDSDSLLKYWRASMAASQLSKFEAKKESRKFELKNFLDGKIPVRLAETLICDFERSLPEERKSNNPVSAPVLVAPLTFLPLHSSGSALGGKKRPFNPLIVPASVNIDGIISAISVNRPGFTGGCFVQMSGYFIKHIQVCIECLLSFVRRSVTNGAV